MLTTTATPETSPPRLLLTIEEAAERLGVGRSTMYGLVLDGEVESVHIGRLRRIPHDALIAYLDQLRGRHPLAPSDG
ncbi:helix-turn-helix domain-containing protein [Jannaschia sp. R86511]|uniref:helix-turn-helix domain-containing protein n=1 Tax=Jannaschia sp. R86511 TaxID=3093853 RepID=UPI0036D3A573